MYIKPAFKPEGILRKSAAKCPIGYLSAKHTKNNPLRPFAIEHSPAFTLAEVLITLAIIGVVAAMTIPSVLNHYQKVQTVNGLKKVYSEFSQAVSLSQLDNEGYEFWDYSLSPYDFFNTYLSGYIQLAETTVEEAKKDYTWLQSSGSEETGLWNIRVNSKIIVLPSGTQIFANNQSISSTDSTTKGFIVDLNGFNKPNQFGKDLFNININKYIGVNMHYKDDNESYEEIPLRTRDELINGPSSQNYQCNKKGRGMWCGALIMTDNWEIKSDYPW
ncbi:MAG: prepilin-type N-terminal cleavage/methylation domain-containing protein [Candidatus Gastranaerophilales bacterium]|nr:prepilin-type N-terminal cleavage/methylation domain-containing protein [Candidatus Gastranaerophilales bacterium]